MIDKYFRGMIPAPRFEDTPESSVTPDGFDSAYLGNTATALRLRLADVPQTDFATTLTEILGFVGAVDGFITANAPWKLAKDPARADRLATVLYLCAEAVRWCTGLLYPFCPHVTAGVWAQVGLGDINDAVQATDLAHLHWGGLEPGTKLGHLAPIFPRADKGLAQTMIDMEEARNTPAAPATSDPGAAPRTSTSDPVTESSATLTVGGSNAQTPSLPVTPGPHTEAPASGAFAATASPQSPAPADEPTTITIDDFMKVELRVAQILIAERIPKADKLLRLEVDLGTERRQILSGIAQHYTPEELIGRRIVVVSNLAPRKMRGLDSHGMLLAASEGPDGKPILASFGEDIALGSRVR